MKGLLIVFYVIVQIFIGVYLSRKIKNEADYFVGGRRVSFFLVSFSLFATWFGAETCLGSSGAVYETGLSGSRADPFGFSLCLFLMGFFLAGQLRKRNYLTLADFIRDRYGRVAEKLVVWVMIPSSIIWGAAQLRAFGQILSVSTAMPLDLMICFSAVLVITYTVLAGLLGDIYTDLIQGVIVVGSLVTLAIVVLTRVPDLPAIFRQMPADRWQILGVGESIWERLDRWAVPVLGSLVVQEAISRFLAARNPREAVRACHTAGGIYFFTGLIPLFLGFIGPWLLPGLTDREQFLVVLSHQYLPGILSVIFLGAMISAILSTVDSILLACAALFSHNFLIPVLGIKKEKTKVLAGRSTVVITGLIALAIALGGNRIYDLVLLAAAFGTAGVLVITMFGLYSRFNSEQAALVTLVGGLVLTPVFQLVLKFRAPFLLSVTSCLVLFVLSSYLFRKASAEVRFAEEHR
ncbi:MAG: putative sodium:solute symporter [Candidatus Saccharicenans subterraneus]|uniref:Putative sodium:solute symporter n=1 Tax=Candidatus Saccharicenans subterraneus TaxID=2508984 RepID=A0A3E2BM85_9BACT|nr:MAG: putative sodium:solute symporter [Candidatus Saccharicenans subterraneum]